MIEKENNKKHRIKRGACRTHFTMLHSAVRTVFFGNAVQSARRVRVGSSQTSQGEEEAKRSKRRQKQTKKEEKRPTSRARLLPPPLRPVFPVGKRAILDIALSHAEVLSVCAGEAPTFSSESPSTSMSLTGGQAGGPDPKAQRGRRSLIMVARAEIVLGP